jgi:ABC-type nitrate/sulfonate/bicarbonate transport system substrate-binding protein
MEENSMRITGYCGVRHAVQRVPKPWFITVLLLAVFLASAGLLATCRKQAEPQPIRITYAMPITVAAIPAYVTLERGYWVDEGLDVDAKMFSAGRLALDALLAKNAQVMSVSETPLVHAILQGNKIFIVATVTAHKEVKLIVRTDHGIRSPADLRGKKIATLPGTNSDFFMYRFLEANNISPRDVKITNMAPPEMVTALVGGNIDAYFAWEPHIYYARERLLGSTAVYPPGDLYAGRHCVAMNQDFVAQHPEVVLKLIRGFIQAERTWPNIRRRRGRSSRRGLAWTTRRCASSGPSTTLRCSSTASSRRSWTAKRGGLGGCRAPLIPFRRCCTSSTPRRYVT